MEPAIREGPEWLRCRQPAEPAREWNSRERLWRVLSHACRWRGGCAQRCSGAWLCITQAPYVCAVHVHVCAVCTCVCAQGYRSGCTCVTHIICGSVWGGVCDHLRVQLVTGDPIWGGHVAVGPVFYLCMDHSRCLLSH